MVIITCLYTTHNPNLNPDPNPNCNMLLNNNNNIIIIIIILYFRREGTTCIHSVHSKMKENRH